MNVVRAWPAPHRLARGSVVAMGNFDGVHRGHQAILAALRQRARAWGGPAVVVTFDPHPARVLAPARAPAMIATLRQRLRALERCGADLVWVVPFDEDVARVEPEDFIERVFVEALGARAIVVGDDARFGRHRRGDRDMLAQWGRRCGFELLAVPPVRYRGQRISSSRIRQAIARGAVDQAADMLGRYFALEGVVVEGDRRGRTLGFPTANLDVDPDLVVPALGVYAGRFRSGEGEHMAAVNVGTRPTFGGVGVRIEAHLLDFDGDLYGATAELAFVQRLRGERRFDGRDALVEQMRRDVAAVRRLLSRLPGATPGGDGAGCG